MLNRDQLQELARFKVLLRKNTAESVQIERFLTDQPYQSQCLDRAEDSDDEELMMLAMTLRARLGRLGAGDQAFLSEIPPTVQTAASHSADSHPVIRHSLDATVAPTESATVKRGLWAKNPVTTVNSASTDRPQRYINSLR